jgi:hypothetical protein
MVGAEPVGQEEKKGETMVTTAAAERGVSFGWEAGWMLWMSCKGREGSIGRAGKGQRGERTWRVAAWRASTVRMDPAAVR